MAIIGCCDRVRDYGIEGAYCIAEAHSTVGTEVSRGHAVGISGVYAAGQPDSGSSAAVTPGIAGLQRMAEYHTSHQAGIAMYHRIADKQTSAWTGGDTIEQDRITYSAGAACTVSSGHTVGTAVHYGLHSCGRSIGPVIVHPSIAASAGSGQYGISTIVLSSDCCTQMALAV